MDDKERSFNPVTPAAKNDIRPGFLGGNGDSGSNSSKDSGVPRGSEAANDLKAAENAAGDVAPKQSEDGLASVRENEESAGGFYSGSGRGEEKQNKKRRFGGVLKKRGPIVAIFMMIFGVGGMMGATQLFQPFSLVAQFQETFNSMHTSANTRSNAFFRMQMDPGRVKNPIKGKIFGSDTFKITKTQSAKLAAQGIEYDDDYNGTGVRVLKYTDDQGQMKIVVADEADIKKVGAGAVDFKKLYADNSDFFNRYNAGSMTWRGAIANWFGTVTSKFFKSNNLTRNMFDDYQKKVAENGGNTKAAVEETLRARTDEVEGGGFHSKEGLEDLKDIEYDEDGNPIREYKPSDASSIDPSATDNNGARNSGEEINESGGKMSRSDMSDSAKIASRLNSIAGSVQKGANITCTVGNVIGAVTLLVTAAEALQIINLTTAYFETVDKVKAGYGDDAPIHDLTNALNEKQINENATLVFNGNYNNIEAYDNKDSIEAIEKGTSDLVKTEYKTSNKTAMESSGIASLYGGGAINQNDPSVQSFNFSGNIKRILGGIGVSMAGFETCAIAKITANVVTAVADGLQVISCIAGLAGAVFTFGLTTAGCAPLVAGIGKKIALSVGIGLAVSAVIAMITPIATKALTRDLISNLAGEDLGNALTSGGNMYLGNTHRANGGSLGTKDKYVAFKVEQSKVIAENAKYERATLSPFDLTSKYTFMGTLLTQMMGFLTTDSLAGIAKTSSSVVSSALVSVLPSASAYDIASDIPDNYMDGYQETCPYLASINAIGDAYCNPYSMTDLSTMNMDPVDVIKYLDDPAKLPGGSVSFLSGKEGETSDGNVKINADSDLAKYILYCDNRESAFGIVDTNIVNAVSNWGSVQTESSTFNTVANSVIGVVPVLGDVIDVVSNQKSLDNKGYVSGESCVAGNDVHAAASPNWEQAKYYQRFIEDQSLAESIGLIEKSAVTAFLDDYYEKNPLDNSYEGILARKSGLSKDTVVAILDLVEYGNFIANYDASERYAFGEPAVEVDNELKFDNENVLAGAFVLLNQISFSDIRNRSFAV